MTNIKFKPGDRVVCVEANPMNGLVDGQIYIVHGLRTEGDYVTLREVDGVYCVSRFKHVLDFEIGDRVQCINPPTPSTPASVSVGEFYTIRDACASGGGWVRVSYKERWYRKDLFKGYPVFEAGDTVVCVDPETHPHLFQGGKYKVLAMRPPFVDLEGANVAGIFANRFKLSTDETAAAEPFKVGDIVLCTDPGPNYQIFEGGRYTVRDVQEPLVYVEGSDHGYYPDRFEPSGFATVSLPLSNQVSYVTAQEADAIFERVFGPLFASEDEDRAFSPGDRVICGAGAIRREHTVAATAIFDEELFLRFDEGGSWLQADQFEPFPEETEMT